MDKKRKLVQVFPWKGSTMGLDSNGWVWMLADNTDSDYKWLRFDEWPELPQGTTGDDEIDAFVDKPFTPEPAPR
jgi:hypothetical protein